MDENVELKDRIQNLEHTILQLQSETETIGKTKNNIFLVKKSKLQIWSSPYFI